MPTKERTVQDEMLLTNQYQDPAIKAEAKLAESERLLKVAREAIERAPHSNQCAWLEHRGIEHCAHCEMSSAGHLNGACLNPPRGIVSQWEPVKPNLCNCWKSRALAGIAPAAPEGEKP